MTCYYAEYTSQTSECAAGVAVCKALNDLFEVHKYISDQHFDLRASTNVRGSTDYETYLSRLRSHSPFRFGTFDGLISISVGVVAAKNANVDEAFSNRQGPFPETITHT